MYKKHIKTRKKPTKNQLKPKIIGFFMVFSRFFFSIFSEKTWFFGFFQKKKTKKLPTLPHFHHLPQHQPHPYVRRLKNFSHGIFHLNIFRLKFFKSPDFKFVEFKKNQKSISLGRPALSPTPCVGGIWGTTQGGIILGPLISHLLQICFSFQNICSNFCPLCFNPKFWSPKFKVSDVKISNLPPWKKTKNFECCISFFLDFKLVFFSTEVRFFVSRGMF